MTEESPNTAPQTDSPAEGAPTTGAPAGGAPASGGGTGRASGTIRSTIARPWLLRIVIITTVLLGYGLWSLHDAYVSYPERGADYASWAEQAYLHSARDVDESREHVGTFRRAAIEDPAGRLEELSDPQTHERNLQDLNSSGRPKRAQMELALEEWLTALDRIGRLHPAYTGFYENPDTESFDRLAELESIPATQRTAGQNDEIRGLNQLLGPMSPRERLESLEARWISESKPSKLQSFDIPVNKIAAFGCFVFSLYLIGLFVGVAMRTYTWNPAEMRLTLPSGDSIVPADLEDIDKRKWDKFIVFLIVRNTHKSIGGREIKVDTYRHGLVETWILEMEKAAFPDRVEEEAAKADAETDSSSEADPVQDGERSTA